MKSKKKYQIRMANSPVGFVQRFAFENNHTTYLASSFPGTTENAFSLLISGNAEHTLFHPYADHLTIEIAPGKTRHLERCSRFRASHIADHQVVTFLRKDADRASIEIAVASPGLKHWKSLGELSTFAHPPVFAELPLQKHRRRIGAFVTIGRKHIGACVGDAHFSHWEEPKTILEGHASLFDASHLEPIAITTLPSGILLLYSAKNSENQLAVGAAILDPDQLTTVRWRTSAPLWKAPHGWYGEPITFLGASFQGKYATLFLQRPGHGAESFPLPKFWETYQLATKKSLRETPKHSTKKVVTALQLVRFHANPILEPRPINTWESMATFNAGAVAIEDRIYLLYRAQGYDGHSVLGYAATHDGMTIDERLDYPIYDPAQISPSIKRQKPRLSSFAYLSGGGSGGCEDPRLTRIEDTLYLTYTDFDGSRPPAMAMTSISIADFLAKRFENWKAPRLISRLGHIQKNWVLFPEKVGGKIAILHNVSPRIMIELVDEIDAENFIVDSCPPRQGDNAHRWDNIIRGAGAPPIRTEYGWLVLYHAMDARDPNKYKVGAMLLDLEHPETILARSPEPILEPETTYENHGHKWGVVFVCGAVIRDGVLFVYYGASDKTLAVASASLPNFLNDLLGHRTPQVKTVTLDRSLS